MTVSVKDLHLVLITDYFPEQYDVLYDGKTVGYLRLRWGNFTVTCPNVGGEVVLEAEPDGHGCFEDDERPYYLDCALNAVMNWCNKNGVQPELGNKNDE